MENHEEHVTHNPTGFWSFLGGLLLGGAAGTIGMVLFVPQSGARTRLQIQQKGIEIRNMANEALEDTVLETRREAHRLNTRLHNQAKKLQLRGQEVLDEQKVRFTGFVETGKTAVHDALS